MTASLVKLFWVALRNIFEKFARFGLIVGTKVFWKSGFIDGSPEENWKSPNVQGENLLYRVNAGL